MWESSQHQLRSLAGTRFQALPLSRICSRTVNLAAGLSALGSLGSRSLGSGLVRALQVPQGVDFGSVSQLCSSVSGSVLLFC